ncbi:MAG: UDP-N-acetylmuramate--L-alanine ligase [Clostridia bacterium]|nr:UDP-N-acetylmuramate--L-alanine ligase [Clostridia bacterium]
MSAKVEAELRAGEKGAGTLLSRGAKVYFIGIGGIGMSALARVLLADGYQISGSDLKASSIINELVLAGAKVRIGHHHSYLPADTDLVVVSSAIGEDNPELQAARELNLPVIKRGQLLALLMKNKKGIAVAGAHGKTTTSSMIARILQAWGADPTILLGGQPQDSGTNGELGLGEYLVAEADESDGSFLLLSPWVTVVTNIEADHLDYYRSLDTIEEAFRRFLSQTRPGGFAVLCADDGVVARIARHCQVPHFLYGIDAEADYVARNLEFAPSKSRCDVYYHGDLIGDLELSLRGRHNIANALAAVTVAHRLGVPFSVARESLALFKGVKRRYHRIGVARGVTVIDDYAHHPTEIRMVLLAARQDSPRRVIAVFQPHRYSRTAYLYREFGKAFDQADIVIVTDVYGAGEKPMAGVSGELVWKAIKENGHPSAYYIPELGQVAPYLRDNCQAGDMVLTLGAGDVYTVGKEFLEMN